MYRALLLAVAVGLPGQALAVGPDDSPPTPTETTMTCDEGFIWDGVIGRCVVIRESRLGDEALYEAARELAYAARYGDAIAALNQMSNQGDSHVLTMLGFTHRQAGRVALGLAYYDRAIDVDPDNLLARSYLGQAHVLAGRYNLARQELDQIRNRNGAGTWAETTLVQAIATGQTTDY